MHPDAGALGKRGIQQIGAHRGRRIDAEYQASSGVINEPPPTPVMPTMNPTTKPETVYANSMSCCRLCSGWGYAHSRARHCQNVTQS